MIICRLFFSASTFSLCRQDPILEQQLLVAIARRSMVFCNSVSADRSGVAASRFLGAAAACVVLLPFANQYLRAAVEQLHQGSLVLRPGAQFYGVFQLGLG